jgi:hypothetical protein
VPGWKGNGRFQTLLRQFEHSVGVNRFFVRLTADIRRCRGEVVRWLSPSEASQKFGSTAGTRWLRPDGAADVLLGRRHARLYLEWDRGTMRLPEIQAKVDSYAAFYASLAEAGAAHPATLIVTTTPQREAEIQSLFSEQMASGPAAEARGLVLSSCSALLDRFGPIGPIWRSLVSSERRDLMESVCSGSSGAAGKEAR